MEIRVAKGESGNWGSRSVQRSSLLELLKLLLNLNLKTSARGEVAVADGAPESQLLETVDGATRWRTPDGPRKARPKVVVELGIITEPHSC